MHFYKLDTVHWRDMHNECSMCRCFPKLSKGRAWFIDYGLEALVHWQEDEEWIEDVLVRAI